MLVCLLFKIFEVIDDHGIDADFVKFKARALFLVA
jgi:hypothetical protein